MALSSLTHTLTHSHAHALFVCLCLSSPLPLFVQAATIKLQWGIACACTFCAVFSGFSAWGTADEILSTKSTPYLTRVCFYCSSIAAITAFSTSKFHTSILMNQGKARYSREADELPVYLSAAESFSFTQTEQQPGSPDAEAHPALDHLPSCQPRALPSPGQAQ
ncbi:hypothetical protein V8C43DRAFT_92002 [Trichoderma afarasin]